MATLISVATGNFTSSSTWATVDSTSLLSSEANSDTLTTGYSGTRSSAFTPGAITIDGIAVKLASRAASPSGTISVQLELDTGDVAVAGTEVTLNVSDLPLCTTTGREGGWIFFKFSSPVLLLAATAYQVAAKTSSSSQVNLWRDGTVDNISRMLRTTTTAAPSAGDTLHVMGEHTGTGTGNDITVTMNETATTDYGAGTADIDALSISKRGTLTWGTSSSTNYYLKLSGDLTVYANGTYNMGTTGTPMPSTSTGVLEFDPAADGDMGFTAMNLSTVNIQGASKSVVWTNLTSDAASSATTVAVTSTSGWAANDELVFTSTTRTASQAERKTIQTVDSATGVTLTAGLTNAHSGTSPVQGEVGNITRNLKIRSATSTLMAYVCFKATATVDIDYVEFYYVGENATDQRGVEIQTTTGSCTIHYCSIHDAEDGGFYLSDTALNNVTLDSNVLYDVNTSGLVYAIYISATTGSSITINNNLIAKSANSSNGNNVYLGDIGITFTNNVISGSTSSVSGYAALAFGQGDAKAGTFSGNIVHSNANVGVGIAAAQYNIHVLLSNFTIYRNNGNGFDTKPGNPSNGTTSFVLDNCTLFGNNGNNIRLYRGYHILRGCTVRSDASFTTAIGLQPDGCIAHVYSCDFSPTSAHTTADIGMGNASQTDAYGDFRVYLYNTPLRASTEIQAFNQTSYNSAYHITNADGGATHKTLSLRGTVASDTTTRHTASGLSWKLTPSSASYPLIYPGPHLSDTMKVAVVANVAVTINAYVYKDSSYNGNAPRLVLVGGILAGISSDVTDSLTVAHSNWELLTVSGTPTVDGVLEFYIDCDGTAGNVYIDDISVS